MDETYFVCLYCPIIMTTLKTAETDHDTMRLLFISIFANPASENLFPSIARKLQAVWKELD